jgi:nucleoside-diphosphate-sugar epimerase
MRFSYSFGDVARVARRWSARSAGPEGVTAAGALWALKEQEVVGKKVIVDRQPQQPGDVPQTWADVNKVKELFGYEPNITFKQGVEKFVEWQKARSSF